jgi:CBS domain-containing protein
MLKFVRDVMSRSVVTCTPETSVHEAARRMTEHRLSALVVVDKASGELEGIVSRSDLARAYEKDYDAVKVESVTGSQYRPPGHHARQASATASGGCALSQCRDSRHGESDVTRTHGMIIKQ